MKRKQRRICVAIVLLIILFLAGCVTWKLWHRFGKQKCELTFMNTGKSDCILIEMDDYVILNDTADEDD